MVVEDRQLLYRLKQGDVTALDTLYTKYRPRLLAAAMSSRADAHLAEDVLHDVFVSLSARMPHLDVKTNLYAYLLAGIVNGIRDRFRKTQRHSRSRPPAGHLRPPPDPQQVMICDEQQQQATRMMKVLPHKQREVVTLRVQSGLPFQEIARVQGVSSSTVRGRYRYGIGKLRKCVC